MFRYVTLVAVLAVASAADAQKQPIIPLDRGLTLTWASSLANEPDYESRVEIIGTNEFGVTMRNSWNRGSRPGAETWRRSDRDLVHQVRLSTRSFYASIPGDNHDLYLASTFLMASTSIWQDLRVHGKADVEFLVPELSQMAYTGTITRQSDETLPIVYNDARTTVRGIRAKGVLKTPLSRAAKELRLSFLFLDDSIAPWLIEVELVRPDGFRGARQLTRISYRPNVEAALEQQCRATVYDIHFATASAEIDPASTGTLAAIAKAMTDHRDWRLQIVGHTDSIGRENFNLDLSRRRAEAARAALVANHHVDGGRLRADGRGEGQPLEDNGTLAGRARNRRVELLRDCRAMPRS